MSSRLERYLKRAADDLPAMPLIATQVTKAAEDPAGCIDDLRRVIQQDAAIAARILKVSNSALYGFPSEIKSLGHAISLLGMRTTRNLVLGATMKKAYKRFGLMEKLLWEHSALAGPLASKLASLPNFNLDPDDAFTAGLLHDIGKTALANSHRDEYEKVVTRVYNEKISFVQAEQDQFDFNHAELGAAVARLWRLPDSLVAVIAHHHDPDALVRLPEADARLTALIAVTTTCLTRLGVGRREPVEELDLASLHAWQYLELTGDDVEPILELCSEQVKAARALID